MADGNYANFKIELLESENVKTINNTSLVGSGNIAVQEPLVSGTNIKTINGNSILGSGDLTISGGGNTDVIGFIECAPNSTLTDDKLQKLLDETNYFSNYNIGIKNIALYLLKLSDLGYNTFTSLQLIKSSD